MTILRSTSRNATVAVYADPDARFNTVTIRNEVQPKKAGSITVYNAKSSINYQKTATIPGDPACTDNCAPKSQEKLSVSVNLSGSTASKAEVLAMWNDVKIIADTYIADLSLGFLPAVAAEITVDNV